MSDPAISPLHRSVSGSKLIDTLAKSLSDIKSEDDLTDAEIGKFLHKGVDAGKSYRTGYAEMPFTSFLRGIERWNGRFCTDTLALIGVKAVPIHPVPMSVQTVQARLARLMMELSLAIEAGEFSEFDRAGLKRTLVEAVEGMDSLRGAA